MIKIGHRGAAGYAPENTLASFRKALEFDIDMVEFDIMVCSTGEAVVIHDYRIDRTAQGKGFVKDKTFEELHSFDMGEGQKIPQLSEVLDTIDRRIKVNIELKGEDAAVPTARILQGYLDKKRWKASDFLVSSFNHYELKRFNAIIPDIPIGAIIAGIPIGYAECAQRLNAYSLHASKEFVNIDIIKDARLRGIKVFVYTVNEPDDIERVKSLGADGIFSDYPDRL